MDTSNLEQKAIERVTSTTLSVFKAIANSAKDLLHKFAAANANVFASVNTLAGESALKTLRRVEDENQRDLHILAREPAVARIVTSDSVGKKITYFISRAAPSTIQINNAKLASYRSPVGRLASLPVGAEYDLVTPTGTQVVEVLERALLHPKEVGVEWDSVNSTLEGHDYGPLTVVSFLALLQPESEIDEVDRFLAEERKSKNVLEGIRRAVIRKMTLRDQPVLDQYQDEIFRLPLEKQLLILGPPGSGKTTTLIRRLGQKLDRDALNETERAAVEGIEGRNGSLHERNWMMFTPTELLKQYVKEAFAREGIAAPDERITTWEDYRRELARNRFGILRTAAGRGSFVLKTDSTVLGSTILRQIEWFEDFYDYQQSDFWNERREAVKILLAENAASTKALGTKLKTIVDAGSAQPNKAAFSSLADLADEIQVLVSTGKAETDGEIRRALNLEFNRNKGFVDELTKFVNGLSDLSDDPEDQDDEDESAYAIIGREAAVAAYMSAVRAHARVVAAKRTLRRGSRSGRIIEWLAERSLNPERLQAVGKNLIIQTAAKRFLNPIQKYLGGMHTRYRRFRRDRLENGTWYAAEGFSPADIGPLEVDVILLAILRASSEFILDRRLRAESESENYGVLTQVRDLYRTQIMVDEATDFSPIQLACMGALSSPQIRSFFACGDFNQRVTEWGSRSQGELKWAFPDIEVRSVTVTYRHSKQLNELAKQLVRLSGNVSPAVLPDRVDNEGVPPVIAKNLRDMEAIASWLTSRIIEIERFTEPLPSVAILVNREEHVKPLAAELNRALSPQNIRVVACTDGQVVGQESDVRVFDVQHIKGLEFEAVFFVGIDELAKDMPSLFDKYLYVGTTRAATYLGLTCFGARLPDRIAAIESSCIKGWDANSSAAIHSR